MTRVATPSVCLRSAIHNLSRSLHPRILQRFFCILGAWFLIIGGMTAKQSRAKAAAPDEEGRATTPEKDAVLQPTESDSQQFLLPNESDSQERLFPSEPDAQDFSLKTIPSVATAPENLHSKFEKDKPAEEELLLPSHEEATVLFHLAGEIRALAPWRWMKETDVFGVQDPHTEEIGFVSIMGNVGEYEAIAVYRTAKGLYDFIDFQSDPSASPDRLIEIPQLQLSFTERKFLEKRDRDLLKGVKPKFSDAGSKPLFRSYRPGYLPWFVTRVEARLLIHALSQTLDVATRLREDPDSLQPQRGAGKDAFLVRVARKVESKLVWKDRIKGIPRPEPDDICVSIDNSVLSELKLVRPSTLQLETDLFIVPGKIGKPGERPLALYALMIADRRSGFIYGFEALTAEKSLAAMYGNVPEVVFRLLLQARILPKHLILRSHLVLSLLEPIAKELKIQLRYSEKLPGIDEAAESMGRWMQS
jgi:hypothetical protein